MQEDGVKMKHDRDGIRLVRTKQHRACNKNAKNFRCHEGCPMFRYFRISYGTRQITKWWKKNGQAEKNGHFFLRQETLAD
jgi:hypothetical protein